MKKKQRLSGVCSTPLLTVFSMFFSKFQEVFKKFSCYRSAHTVTIKRNLRRPVILKSLVFLPCFFYLLFLFFIEVSLKFNDGNTNIVNAGRIGLATHADKFSGDNTDKFSGGFLESKNFSVLPVSVLVDKNIKAPLEKDTKCKAQAALDKRIIEKFYKSHMLLICFLSGMIFELIITAMAHGIYYFISQLTTEITGGYQPSSGFIC